MRILIIGASGQLGRALVQVFGAKHDLVLGAFRHPRGDERVIDLGDREALAAALAGARPDAVLIAGAQVNVDRCESEPAECERINVEGPRVIAQYAREHDARVVLYSTDHVFDGSRERFTEREPIAPFNAYARAKAAAEAAMRTIVPDAHLILRTSWLYGPDRERRNFALRLVDRIRDGHATRVPSDQQGCPTYTDDVAAATFALMDRGDTGTFHAVGPDVIDRVDLARRVCAAFGLPDDLVVPTPTADLGQVAPRPLRVVLDSSKLSATVGVRFRNVDSGLAALAAAM